MPTKKLGRQNYDWNMIMMDYVTDPNATLKSIAEKYKIRRTTVNEQSRDNSWLATKKKYQKEVVKKAVKKAAIKNGNELARELSLLDKLEKVMEKAMEDEEQFYRHIVTESAPAPEGIGVVSVTYDKVMPKLDDRAYSNAIKSLKLIEDMRRSMSIIRRAEEQDKSKREWEKVRIEQERLEMDKAKQEYQKPDGSIHVTIGGYEEGWCD